MNVFSVIFLLIFFFFFNSVCNYGIFKLKVGFCFDCVHFHNLFSTWFDIKVKKQSNYVKIDKFMVIENQKPNHRQIKLLIFINIVVLVVVIRMNESTKTEMVSAVCIVYTFLSTTWFFYLYCVIEVHNRNQVFVVVKKYIAARSRIETRKMHETNKIDKKNSFIDIRNDY